MKDWMLIDVSSICWRFFHVMGDLSYHLIKSGVVFGFLKNIHELQDRFCIRNVVFCFDIGDSKRCEMFEGYKAKRRAARLAVLDGSDSHAQLDTQIEHLRTRYLPAIGYRNVVGIQGYEADDLIASVALQVKHAIIVSSDRDFFQLLTPTIRQWLPDRQWLMTIHRFQEKYGIEPRDWVTVKAMTGCKTDEIPGIGGVGEITALKYVKGGLVSLKRRTLIQSLEASIKFERNAKLVKLPLPGTPKITLHEDRLSLDGWYKVCDHLGMKSIREELPPGLRQ